ncbi:hypothetical protein LEN26_007644 [Aphanomyces euteiches]|nr:hypothetical protein LEN26_007644 [Aphanomyces euteiches]
MSTQVLRHEFIEGETFTSMAALKNEVARYFAERNLAFRLPVNDKVRLTVVCLEHLDCPFVLRARRVRNCDTVKITSVDNSHASELVDIYADRIRAPNRVRGALLVPVAEEKSKTDYRLTASRMQAWRAKQKVLSASLDEGKESYKYLQDWLHQMKISYPSASIRFDTAENRFLRCGLVYGQFDQSFDHMLPVLALDACHLKTKDKGTLYVASMLTGNFDVLIVGMAISNASERENKADWTWFLQTLVEALPCLTTSSTLVVVSDRDKGLIPAVCEVLPSAHHSFCSVHIKRNVTSRFGTGLGGTIHLLARCVLKNEVDSMMSDLGAVHPEIANYLNGIDKTTWISAYFAVPRYGIVTSNAAESMNSWIDKERLTSHLAALIRITRKINTRLADLSRDYSRRENVLCPRLVDSFKKMMDSALRREILDYGEICEVKRLASNEYRTVNLSLRTCSCQVWQDRLYPCVHGYAVILARRLQVSDFVDHVYTTAACISVTSVRLTPVDIENCSSDSSTLPPLVRSTVSSGKKRIPSRGEEIVGGKPNQKKEKSRNANPAACLATTRRLVLKNPL